MEAWKPVRSKCVKFRKVEQSCISNSLKFGAYECEPGAEYDRQENVTRSLALSFEVPDLSVPGLTLM